MCGHHSYGGLPGVVSVRSVEYDAAKVRLRIETSLGNVGRLAMAKRGSVVLLMTILTMAVLGANCANATKQMPPTISFHPTPLMLPIPADVQLVAVLW
jgi:hypothetical protein